MSIDCPDLKSANDAMYVEIEQLGREVLKLRCELAVMRSRNTEVAEIERLKAMVDPLRMETMAHEHGPDFNRER
jgi:hypothetical protein